MMAEQADEKIMERIQKLYAKGVSAREIGSEAEALAFLSAAQKMMDRYELSMSDIEFQLALDKDPVKMHAVEPEAFGRKAKKRRILWEELLSRTVAKANKCSLLPIKNSNVFWLIGRREHREVAEFMIITLQRTVEALADKAYTAHFYRCRDRGDATEARGYRNAYIQGFVGRIIERYAEIDKAKEGLNQQERGVAMIRLSKEMALIKVFQNELKATGFTHQSKVIPHHSNKDNDRGHSDGRRDANNINLSPNALQKNANAPSPRAITMGQRLLGGG